MKKNLLLLLLYAMIGRANGQPPTITSDIYNTSACITGGYTFLYIGANNVTSYAWQVSTDGGNTWVAATNGSTYQGSAAAEFDIFPPDFSFNLYEYRCIVSNANGSDTSHVSILFMATAPPGATTLVNPPTEACLGSTVVFHATNVGPADSIFWTVLGGTVSPNGLVGDSVVLVNFTSITTPQFVAPGFVANGCGTFFNNSSAEAAITVNPLQSNPAGIAGGGADCASFSVFPGVATTYSDGTCSPIAAVTPSGSSPVSGSIQSCVTVDASVPSFNGIPYVARYYAIEPATNPSTSTATLTLYFTQADFDAYNVARGSNPALPTGPSDATGIANVTISQFHGTGTTPDTYVGTAGTIIPSNVTWNSTASRWEITFSVTGFSGFFVSGGSIVPLPLTLVSFTGQSTKAGNVLHWETTMEENTEDFDLQRAAEGETGFATIATVAAAGNSDRPRDYTYTDATAGGAVSYRLKMNDLNGNFSYSRILTLGAATAAGLAVRVSPNPFLAPASINVTVSESGGAILTITDVAGHRVAEQSLTLQMGTTSVDPMILANLAPGVYFLSIITDQGKQTVQVFKQ
jgi:hypothetical protein